MKCLRREYFTHSKLLLNNEEELVHRFLNYFGGQLSEYPDVEEIARAKAEFIHGALQEHQKYPEWIPDEPIVIQWLASYVDKVVAITAPKEMAYVEHQPLLTKFLKIYQQIEQERY